MADSEYAEIFREEAGELLEELETSLLELEKDPADLKIVSRVFRAMHTIKGSGAMFGFDDIAGFTHHVETALDKVRDGTVPVSKELIDLTLASRDHIRALLDAATGGGAVDSAEGQRIIVSLQALVGGGAPDKDQATPAPASSPLAMGEVAGPGRRQWARQGAGCIGTFGPGDGGRGGEGSHHGQKSPLSDSY